MQSLEESPWGTHGETQRGANLSNMQRGTKASTRGHSSGHPQDTQQEANLSNMQRGTEAATRGDTLGHPQGDPARGEPHQHAQGNQSRPNRVRTECDGVRKACKF